MPAARRVASQQQSQNYQAAKTFTRPANRYGKNARLSILLKDSFTSLLRSPPKSAVIVCTVLLTLPAAVAIFSSSFKAAEENLLENRHITVFLNTKVSIDSASQLATTLATNQYIHTAELTPVAIQDSDILTIDIQPSASLNKAHLDNIVSELNSHTSVDFVAADSSWLQRNVDAINTTKKLAWLSISVTALITMLLACLITGVDLRRQKTEMQVLHQMGASHATLLKPLMLRCLILTVIALGVGTLLAWGFITILSYLDDLSSYKQVLPRSIPAQHLASLLIIALFSSLLTVKLLGKKTIKSL